MPSFMMGLIAIQNFDPSFPKILWVPKVLSKNPWVPWHIVFDLFSNSFLKSIFDFEIVHSTLILKTYTQIQCQLHVLSCWLVSNEKRSTYVSLEYNYRDLVMMGSSEPINVFLSCFYGLNYIFAKI